MHINDFVSNIFVGTDGKLHKVQGGADTVLPFSSISTRGLVWAYAGRMYVTNPDWFYVSGDKIICSRACSIKFRMYTYLGGPNHAYVGSITVYKNGAQVGKQNSSAFVGTISGYVTISCAVGDQFTFANAEYINGTVLAELN